LSDILLRVLEYLKYDVDYIMNITDVGHLTGDNLGDADIGEDKLEKAARKERKTAWEIAKVYTRDFLEGFDKLNLTKPKKFTKATDYIREQIELIIKIEKAGFTYRIGDGIYFDVGKYIKAGNKYGELSTLDEIEEGARVKRNPEKRDPRDFALWKFSPSTSSRQGRRDMEWESPWGIGFPGWHIECSAMSIKYLGERFDIHVGGEDLRSTHHPNEIAQAEAATGRWPFVKYWVHGAFLLVNGGRMGKSLGNAYTLSDVEEKGFNALDLRYFYLTAHYRKQQNFTWDALGDARRARLNLTQKVATFYTHVRMRSSKIEGKGLDIGDKYRERFVEAISNDLNMPEALAVVWELVRSKTPDSEKYRLLMDFDKVLGLGLGEVESGKWKMENVSKEIQRLVEQREKLRKEKKWDKADKIRKKIEKMGYKLEDTPEGPGIKKFQAPNTK
jgi:cysteinyl-tRNA synthetase